MWNRSPPWKRLIFQCHGVSRHCLRQQPETKPFIWLRRIWHEAYRRQGIAARLLQDFMQESEKRGIHSFTLEVRVSNTAAIRLYESCGFQIEGTRKGFYDKPKEDAYIMWKR